MAFRLRSQNECSPIKQKDTVPEKEITNPYKKKLEKYTKNADGTYSGEFAQNINASRNTSQAKAETKNIMKMIERGENAKAFAEGNKGGLFGSTKNIGGSGTTSSYSWSNNPSAKVDRKEVLNALKKSGGVEVEDGIVTPTNTRKVSKTINAKQYGMLEAKANQLQKRIDEKSAAIKARKQKLTNKNKQ